MATWKTARSGETEAEFRQFLAYLFEQVSVGKAETGTVAGMGVTATTPSANGSVVVGMGLAVSQPSTSGGAFPLPNGADTSLDIFTSNPMQFVANPRNDIVGVDQTTGSIAVLTGTAAAVPADPTIPSTFVPLARLRHAANATTIPSSKIDDLRVKVSLMGGADESFNVRGVPMAGASTTKAGKRIHWGAYTAGAGRTTGFATITHGAGFTPTAVVITPQTSGLQFKVDTIGATTFRVQVLNSDGTANNSDVWTFSAFLGE